MKTNTNRAVSTIFGALAMLTILTAGIAFGQEPAAKVIDMQQSGATAAPADVDTAAIEKIVRNYILKNPTVIRDAMNALQAQEQREKEERTASVMKDLKRSIYADPDSPVSGNASGDVSIVVFFDYNCGYCKKTLPQLKTLSEKDPLVRIIYKEFPILGSQSQTAAKAALAAARQGKYVEFHNALIASPSTSDEAIKEIATSLGIDYARLQKDMADPKIDEQLERNLTLAGSLNINGTPAYIVGDQLIPGAIDEASLAKLVTAQRAKLTATTAATSGGDR